MISIAVIFVVLAFLLLCYRFSRKSWLLYTMMFTIVLLILESVVFGYFLVQIVKGKCFFLIGQEKSIDLLIKARLNYSIYFPQSRKTFINRVDEDLGYTLSKNKETGIYRTNSQAMRSNRDYSLFPDSQHLRMAAMGDSFVFCDGEEIKDCWTTLVENSTSNLEVLNFGVPGYGLGQSYLRYVKYARAFHPDIIFINYCQFSDRDRINSKDIVTLNDLRIASFYRVRFWIEDGILKEKNMSPFDLFDPEFRKKYLFDEQEALRKKHLEFLNHITFLNTGVFIKQSIVQKLVGQVRTTGPNDDEIKIEYKILNDFIEMVKRDGAQILFFCHEKLEEMPAEVQKLILSNESTVTYVYFNRAFENELAIHHAQDHNVFNISGHYTPEGNQYYAQALLKVLKSRSWCRKDKCFHL